MEKIDEFLVLDSEVEERMEQEFSNIQNKQGVVNSTEKFNPSLVSNNLATPIHDFYWIPLDDNLIPFQLKNSGDFSKLDDSEIEEMARSMDEEGAYEPVLLRQIGLKKYEILAGEHRVLASRKKGLKKIKAIVYRHCSDEKAKDIFLLTNLQRRQTKISDAIYGWYSFYENHPEIKTRSQLNEEITSVYVKDVVGKTSISIAEFYRYVKMHDLIPEMIQKLDEGKLAKRAGYHISFFDSNIQKLLLPYVRQITEAKISKLRKLSRQEEITEEIIQGFFEKQKKPKQSYDSTLRCKMIYIKKSIRTKLNPNAYGKLDIIFDIALDDYLKKHPEDAQIII